MSAYTDPDVNVQKVIPHPESAGAGTANYYAEYRHHALCSLKEVTGIVKTAGTGTGAKLVVYKNTTSIGEITLGTNTKGVQAAASLTDTTFQTTDTMGVKCSGDATLEAYIVYQVQELPVP